MLDQSNIHQGNLTSFPAPPSDPVEALDFISVESMIVRLQVFNSEVPTQESLGIHRGRSISHRIHNAINESRSILSLPDNWDDEGSPRYAEATWKRAVDFIVDASMSYRRIATLWVVPPTITPGPQASIDIHWQWRWRELLINVPPSADAAVTYYGSGRPNDTIKGCLDTSSHNEWILAWLLR